MFAHLISKFKHITKVTYLGLHESMSHSAGQINGAVVLDIYITLVNFFFVLSPTTQWLTEQTITN